MKDRIEELLRVIGLEGLDAKIIAVLSEKPMSPMQLSQHLGLPTSTIYTRLVRLKKKGLVFSKLKLYGCRTDEIRERIRMQRDLISKKKNALEELERIFSLSPDGGEKDDGKRDTDS